MGNNPITYTDPDGRQVSIPYVPAPPLVLPKVIPSSIPTTFPPLPLFPSGSFPGNNLLRIEKKWNGDWRNAPSGPDMNNPESNPLGDDWKPDKEANERDPTKQHKWFDNIKTRERARWDAPTDKQEGHWHRENVDKIPNKYYKYLDPDGKPVKAQDPRGHIIPKPLYDYVPHC